MSSADRSPVHRVAAIAVAIAVAAVTLTAVTTAVVQARASTGSPSGAERRAAQAWSQAITQDEAPLTGAIVPLLEKTHGWLHGSVPTSALLATIGADLPGYLETRTALALQPPLPQAPQALDDYRQATALYIEAVRVEAVAVTLPAGPLRSQLVAATTRIDDLGDRVFDQGAALVTDLEPPAPASPDVHIAKPAEVPDWVSLGLAAGPPLTALPPPPRTAVAPARYQPARPQESFGRWRAAVQQAGIPPGAAEAGAITGRQVQPLRVMGAELAAAVTALDAAPDPRGQRPVSTRLRLGLLVDAEATTAAQAAALVADPAQQARLTTIAETLAVIGDDLWDPMVAPRSTGFPHTLLARPGT